MEEQERRKKETAAKMKAQMDAQNEERRLLGGYESADQMFIDGSVGDKSVRASMQMMPYSGIKNMRNMRAIQEIEKIKQSKI